MNNGWTGIPEFARFLETVPLYKKLKIAFPAGFHQMIPASLKIRCHVCKEIRTFRDLHTKDDPNARKDEENYQEYVRTKSESSLPTSVGFSPPPAAPKPSGFYNIHFQCSDCQKGYFLCWVEVSLEKEYVQKVGQHPIWLPPISKELEKELWEDAELYQKALRNMNEGYGIGACAYLRRLMEKYINPLLQLLYEVKNEQGATPEELNEIQETIRSKDFSAKTKYASAIAPPTILVEGENPLKLIHEHLSVAIHSLEEGAAIEYALTISAALEFAIPALRKQLEERKAFVKKLKEIKELN